MIIIIGDDDVEDEFSEFDENEESGSYFSKFFKLKQKVKPTSSIKEGSEVSDSNENHDKNINKDTNDTDMINKNEVEEAALADGPDACGNLIKYFHLAALPIYVYL